MYISGDNITTFLCHVKTDFKPKTRLALQWIQTASGAYKASDRGASSDIYESEIRLYSRESTVNLFVNAVYNNRTYDTNYFTMSGFEDTEHIFGEDVDYSVPINVTVIGLNGPVQKTWLGFEVTATVRALSPLFASASTLPTLRYADIGYDGNVRELTINKIDTYSGSFSYQEHGADVGVWEGTLLMCGADMGNLRRYISVQRGNTISIPSISGISHPFGPYRSGFPISCKVIKWEDLGMMGPNNWKIKLTLAEEV